MFELIGHGFVILAILMAVYLVALLAIITVYFLCIMVGLPTPDEWFQ